MANADRQSPHTTVSPHKTLPQNPYPFPDPNADMQPTHNNPISGLPLGSRTDQYPENWSICTPGDAGPPRLSHEEMDRIGRETPFLTDEDEERVDNGGLNRKKWSWEREGFKKQVSSSLPKGRFESSKSKPGLTQEREDRKEVSSVEHKGKKMKRL
jgi:hypothetical protein